MNYDREFSIALLEVKTLGTPRAQITLDRMMFLVALAGVLVWLAMVAEYNLSGRAYDDWVDGASCSISFSDGSEPVPIEPTSRSVK